MMRKMKSFFMAVGISLLGLCAFAIPAAAKDEDGDIVVVIDAGHGGEDSGKIATTGCYESNINLVIATSFRDELMKYDGIKVYLTRSDDNWLSNTGRSMVAAAMNADFLISCHNNSSESSESTGSLVIRSVNQFYAESTNEMASLILDNLSELGLANGGVTSRTDDTYQYEDYYTLIGEGVRAGVPSIIIEHCFLSNETDALFVSNADGSVNTENCKKLGVADANAVVKYFGLTKRTAKADESVLTLPKNYSVQVVTPNAEPDATWYSLDSTIASITADGVATALNAGTTNLIYKLSNGDTGYLTLTVEPTQALALVGCMKTTFYDDTTATTTFANVDLNSLFGFVIYNDGTSMKVTPTFTGSIDYNQVGIQDIPIAYDGLTGTLRLCHKTAEYVPVVTEPETETETETQTETATEEVTGETEVNVSNSSDDLLNKTVTFKVSTVLKFAIALLVLILIGVIILIIENNKKKRRRHHRRYY